MGASASSQMAKEMFRLQGVIDLLVKQLNLTLFVAKKALLFLKQNGISIESKILGRGGSGVILSGVEVSTHTPVAVKIQSPKNDKEYKRNIEEYQIIDKLNSPFVAKGVFSLETCIKKTVIQYFIMEKCQYDLDSQEKAIKKQQKVYIYKMALDLVKGLIEIHNNSLIHLDIKPKNIVYGQDKNWKFIDMGICTEIQPEIGYVLKIKGLTFDYCSPEQFQLYYGLAQNRITQSSDIYSLGLVFLLLTGIYLNKQDIKISKIQSFDFENVFNPHFKQFNQIIKEMIRYQPRERIRLMSVYSQLNQLYKTELSLTQNECSFQPKSAVSLDSLENLSTDQGILNNKSISKNKLFSSECESPIKLQQ